MAHVHNNEDWVRRQEADRTRTLLANATDQELWQALASSADFQMAKASVEEIRAELKRRGVMG